MLAESPLVDYFDRTRSCTLVRARWFWHESRGGQGMSGIADSYDSFGLFAIVMAEYEKGMSVDGARGLSGDR